MWLHGPEPAHLSDHARANFQALLGADDGNPALLERTDAATGAPHHVVWAVGRDSGVFLFMPFEHLAVSTPTTPISRRRLRRRDRRGRPDGFEPVWSESSCRILDRTR